jgi:hypothetical protein
MWRKKIPDQMKSFDDAVQRTTAAFQQFSMVMALCEMEAACEREFSNRVADWLRYN